MDSSQKIILFSVMSFDLEQLILTALKKKGFAVTFLDERPSNRKWMKALIRLCPSCVKFYVNKYYEKILKSEICDDADYAVVLRAEVVPIWFLKKIKKRNPNLKMIYYGSDSFRNNPAAIDKLPFFDKKYTFDPEDAQQHHIEHLPLFYEDEYLEASKKKYLERDYDVSFIGTVHSDRVRLVSKIAAILNPKKVYFYFYHYGYWILLLQKWFGMVEISKNDIKKVQYHSLSKNEIRRIYQNSKIILDIHHPRQKGLTMRTFEALGAGAKIITTNAYIKNYDFYDPRNILILDRLNVTIPYGFFQVDAQPYNKNILKKYTLSSWLKQLLN